MVLDAAYAVFLERGYDGASMEVIAQKAGVTKPVVYNCFASKDELFTALLVREERRILAEIAAAIPARAEDDLERTVSDGLTAFLRSVAASPDAYRILFLGEGGGNAAIATRIEHRRLEQVDTIAALMEDWLERRGTGDSKVTGELIAFALVGAAEGAARALLSDSGRFDPETAGRMLAQVVVRGASGL